MSLGDVLKGGLTGGLVGAAKAGGVGLGDIARNGGLGLIGMLAAKKRREAGRRPMDEQTTGRAGPGSDIRMMSKKKGGKVKTKKMAAGGSASKRADGCATKGKTKGKFI
jgi:hypothetical protein